MVIKVIKWLQSLFQQKRSLGKIIPFPCPNNRNKKYETALQKYLSEQLKAQGYKVILNVSIYDITYDLYLPHYRIAVFCPTYGTSDIYNKVFEYKLKKYARKQGWRFVTIHPAQLYKGLNDIFIRTKQDQLH